MQDRQKTIAKELSLSGTGLHTANKVSITFKPAEVDSGINFVRTDLAGKFAVTASLENLLPQTASLRRTSIGKDGTEIQTVEHLMAALSGLRIDNLRVEMDNNEVPGLDGSSDSFVQTLSKAGIKEQDKERKYYVLREPVFVEEEGTSIVALPYNGLKISYFLSYPHPLLKAQFLEVNLQDSEIFKNELASARTFCLESEARDLQHQGLGHGASYENTLVVGESGVLKNKLRYADEFVRHKILDLLGDLYILGPLKAHIIALKSGHSLNLKLVKKIDQQRQKNLLGGIGINYHPKEGEVLDLEGIKSVLPHRDPFLFVEKIIHLEPGKRIVGTREVRADDYFFKGHFPGKPVMPGVLILEAMAQVGGVMMLSPQENRGKLAYFMAIDNVKFRKTVVPGDQLVFEVEAVRLKSKTGQVRARALVDNKVVAEANLMFAFAEP